MSTPDLRIRPARPGDVPALTLLLNEIIRAGGTTALETELSEDGFGGVFLDGAALACHVAEAGGEILGFQAIARHPDLPADWCDIATFTRQTPRRPGVGSALFAVTRERTRGLGCSAINAAIRADNEGGLAFYARMGFETYRMLPAVPLTSGEPVDRILKRYDLR